MDRKEFIRRFDIVDDMKYVNLWLIQREMDPWPIYEFPEIGFITFDGETPIAVAFLRKVEGNFALFDGLITNPKASAEIRNKFIDGLAKAIILKAKVMGLSKIFGFSTDKNTLERADRHGFERLDYKVVCITL